MKTFNAEYRTGLALAVVTPLAVLWMIGAAGVIGAAGNRADIMYLGVFAVAVVGALVARLHPYGMVVASSAAAMTQAVVGAIGLGGGLSAGNPPLAIVGLTGMFMMGFGGSALLFQRAAHLMRPVDRTA